MRLSTSVDHAVLFPLNRRAPAKTRIETPRKYASRAVLLLAVYPVGKLVEPIIDGKTVQA